MRRSSFVVLTLAVVVTAGGKARGETAMLDAADAAHPGTPSVTPWFTWPLWPPPVSSLPSPGVLATPTWPPPAPLQANPSLVHPLWPPEPGAPVASVAPNDEALPPFGVPLTVDELPRIVSRGTIQWPEGLFAEPVTVNVVVMALVDSHGRVRDTRVTTRQTPFTDAAMATVRTFTFAPARSNGRPVATWVAVPIRYHRE